MKQWFRIKRINARITLSFSILLICIVLIISFLSIRLYSNKLSNQIELLTEQKLNLMTDELSASIEHIKQIHSSMVNDVAITAAFKKVVKNYQIESLKQLTALLNDHPSVTGDRRSVIAFGINGEIYHANYTFPAYRQLLDHIPEFDMIREKQIYYYLSTPNTFPLEYTNPTEQQKNNLTMVAQFYDYDKMELLGYLAINFRTLFMFGDIEKLSHETFTSTYVIDEYNNVVFQTGDIDYANIDGQISSTKQTFSIGNNDYIVLSKPVPSYTRWKVITLFDKSVIASETARLNKFIYLTLLVGLMLMVLISWLLSQQITHPIKSMIASMKEFEHGNWPMPLYTESRGELQDLIYGYNSMLINSLKLTDNIIERHQENKRIEIDLIQTQLGLLEAQINPHFIHNTLNSMNYLALKENNHELSTIIESFNKLLRTSMAIEVSFITVAQEIENLKAYEKIQSSRFPNTFEISYAIDPEALIAKIPKLILQPLVENSIKHGILPKGRLSIVNISVNVLKSELNICVCDDGIGMSPERVKEITRTDSKQYVSKHIGIANVIERIKLYYGDGLYFNIDSTLGIGTTITFTIPYED